MFRLIRLPFLFGVGLFFGSVAYEARKEQKRYSQLTDVTQKMVIELEQRTAGVAALGPFRGHHRNAQRNGRKRRQRALRVEIGKKRGVGGMCHRCISSFVSVQLS